MGESQNLKPDYIFEISWEVCNKVGGIHTVLATKALSMVKEWEDNYVLIGPDIWKGTGEHPEFAEDTELFSTWKSHVEILGIKMKVGRWKITGNPLVVLIDFTDLYPEKNEILKKLWLDYEVDSLTGQWDYIEPTLFGYAAGMVIECFYNCHLTFSDQIIAHSHEWLTAAAILYLEKKVPQIATVFTTHATIVGRTIAGNELPFYSQFEHFNADQQAKRWNIVSKHSMEKAGAKNADCFATVSQLTARECTRFLGRSPDILTPNGFDDVIVPRKFSFEQKRKAARKKLISVARAVTATEIDDNCLLVLKSGRYEFRNKGIDVFIDAISELNKEKDLKKKVVAFICVPAHHTGARTIIQQRLESANSTAGDDIPASKFLTHHLQGVEYDPVIQRINQAGIKNDEEDNVRIIFASVYLDGTDGIFNLTYYDLLTGFDVSAFPSYYEPWGYTPLESLAFFVPAITTDVAGFGLFIKPQNTGVFVLHRDDNNDREVVGEIAVIIKQFTENDEQETEQIRQAAGLLSRQALWKNLLLHYREAYSLALNKTKERTHLFQHEPEVSLLQMEDRPIALSNEPTWRKIFIQLTYPEELKPLENLSKNLWWSWNIKATDLFEKVDADLWRRTHHNPIKMLNNLSLVRMKRLLRDKSFLHQLKEVHQSFEAYMRQQAPSAEPLVAYFCMEYGLVENLKLYSGGLGILAGDYLKAASDANHRVVGIGLLYRNGFFHQKLSLYGDQLVENDPHKFTELPLVPVRNATEEWLKINIALPGRTLYAKVWRVPVGRTSLYLLDTDIPENRKDDRRITDHLYAGDAEQRLKQELLLGIGGVRLLHALELHPDIYHCNEGHAAFMGLERLYHHVLNRNISFEEALELVRASTLFTTHTPVEAGHDRFDEHLLRAYISQYTVGFNITWERLMQLGRVGKNPDEKFSMSNLAASIAQEVNGVSKVNEAVSRKIFHPLWSSFALSELHIGHVTNGVHYATWTAPQWRNLYQTELGENPVKNLQKPEFWKKIDQVSDQKIWDAHQSSKARLISKIKEKLTSDLTAHHEHPSRIADSLHAINEHALFVGFARRFVPYKRATLLFHNLTRLSEIVNNEKRPVVILFAGKAHPTDFLAQRLIKKIISMSYQKEFLGKVIFLENYNMELARYLVSGVDLWLNTPERGMEASGTSGMKAAFNGVLNFSILDGWWSEAYREDCGWALGDNPYEDQEHINEVDAEDIYRILETDIAPDFFQRSEGVPLQWTAKMKHAIAQYVPQYNALRMFDDYSRQYYTPLHNRTKILVADDLKKLRELAAWKKMVIEAWPNIRVESMKIHDSSNKALPMGEMYEATLELFLDTLTPKDLYVEIVFIEKRRDQEPTEIIFSQELELAEQSGKIYQYMCRIPMTLPGVYEHSFRFCPKHPLLPHRQDFPLMKWL